MASKQPAGRGRESAKEDPLAHARWRFLKAGPKPANSRPASNIGVGAGFGAGAGMGDSTLFGVANGLRIPPQAARLMVAAARLPCPAPLGEFGGGQRHVDGALLRVDRDHVAVADQADRPADRRFRADMANAEAVRGARKAPVG